MVCLINFIGQKTLKRVRLFYVTTSFTSAIPTTKYTFFPKATWVHVKYFFMMALKGCKKDSDMSKEELLLFLFC